MREPRSLRHLETQHIQHRIDMLPNTAATLHRQSGWLVQGEDIGVTVKYRSPKLFNLVIAEGHARTGISTRQLSVATSFIIQGRDTDRLALDHPRRGLGATAVQSDLASAEELFQPAM